MSQGYAWKSTLMRLASVLIILPMYPFLLYFHRHTPSSHYTPTLRHSALVPLFSNSAILNLFLLLLPLDSRTPCRQKIQTKKIISFQSSVCGPLQMYQTMPGNHMALVKNGCLLSQMYINKFTPETLAFIFRSTCSLDCLR